MAIGSENIGLHI